jgi:hypothetical protein
LIAFLFFDVLQDGVDDGDDREENEDGDAEMN